MQDLSNLADCPQWVGSANPGARRGEVPRSVTTACGRDESGAADWRRHLWAAAILLVKDLTALGRIWYWPAALCLATSILALAGFFADPAGRDFFRGLVGGTWVSAGVVAAQALVQVERKRRHLILLRTLPISSRGLVWMKYFAGLLLLCLVATASSLPLMLSPATRLLAFAAPAYLILIPFAAFLLVAAILVRDLMVVTSAGLIAGSATVLFWSDLVAAGPWMVYLESWLPLWAPLSALVLLEVGAVAVGRRELDF